MGTIEGASAVKSLPTHGIKVVNESGVPLDFVGYWGGMDAFRAETVSWFARHLANRTSKSFYWTEDFGVTWAEADALEPGVQLLPGQVASVDGAAGLNGFVLSKDNDAYAYVDPWISENSLLAQIRCDQYVRMHEVALGVTLGGDQILAVPAFPNMSYVFEKKTFKRQLRVAHVDGGIQKGEVLNTEALEATSFTVPMPIGTTGAVVTLNPDRSWTVKETRVEELDD